MSDSKLASAILMTVVHRLHDRRENSVGLYAHKGYSHDGRVVQRVCAILMTVKQFCRDI